MAGLTFNGRPFNAKEFEETLMQNMRKQLAAHVRGIISTIRDPATGEFPTVVVDVDGEGKISARVEGSPEVIALVQRRLAEFNAEAGSRGGEEVTSAARPPKVFLSYAWEDCDLAKRIARALMAAGIDTFWAEWSIKSGDSLPQKINEGIGGCTHFVVLLTPTSVKKRWVQTEMDAGLIKRISDEAAFIPLRHNLAPKDLPLLLRALLSPEVNNPPEDIQQLINDIHGISSKPPLGPPPAAKATTPPTGYSAAANAVAKIFVERSAAAISGDQQMVLDDLIAATGLTRDDVVDGLHELGAVLEKSAERGSDRYFAKDELFARFDGFFRDWNPADDALRIGADLVNDPDFPTALADISERYGWPPRRLNAAVAYLINREIVYAMRGIFHAPWTAISIEGTDATRRFVRSRAR